MFETFAIQSGPTTRDVFLSREGNRTETDQATLESEFFRRVMTRNKVTKTTCPGRLNDLNETVLPLLPNERPLHVMDVAISSGISTMEWIDDLRSKGIDVQMIGSDLTVKAYLISVCRAFEVLVDRQGCIMHFDISGIGIPGSANKPHYRLVTAALRMIFLSCRWLNGDLRRMVPRHLSTLDSRPLPNARTVTLVSTRLQTCPFVEIMEDDIFGVPRHQLVRQLHVLRAANILNRRYFGDEALRGAVRNLRSRLRENGLLIVCRTGNDGLNRATVFQLNSADRLDVVLRLRDGSEIEELVLSA
jgi:hypothetical protein